MIQKARMQTFNGVAYRLCEPDEDRLCEVCGNDLSNGRDRVCRTNFDRCACKGNANPVEKQRRDKWVSDETSLKAARKVAERTNAEIMHIIQSHCLECELSSTPKADNEKTVKTVNCPKSCGCSSTKAEPLILRLMDSRFACPANKF